MEKIILQFQKIESKLKNFFTSDVKTNGKKLSNLVAKQN